MTPNPPQRGLRPAAKNPFGKSAVLTPRARLLVGGQTVAVVSAEVTNNNYWAADTWNAVVALGPDPQRDVDFWGSQDEFEVEVLLGLQADDGTTDWRSFLTGRAARVRIDSSTEQVHLDGRDFTSDLIETQIVDSYHDVSASDVAAMFAAEHGLSADVDPTPGKIGALFQHEHAGVSTGQLSHASNQWDYLCWLAQQYEGYAVWVRGRTLFFKQVSDDDREKFVVTYRRGDVETVGAGTVRSPSSADAIKVEPERDMTRAKDIEVVVRSWHGAHAQQFEVVARRTRSTVTQPKAPRRGRASGGDPILAGIPNAAASDNAMFAGLPGFNTPRPAQRSHSDKAPPKENGIHRYIYERSGLSPAEALAFAQARLKEATLHERKVVIVMPGELELDARRMVTLAGYGKGWDQDYYVAEIVRRISMKGFEQTITLKNESPGGTTIIATTS